MIAAGIAQNRIPGRTVKGTSSRRMGGGYRISSRTIRYGPVSWYG
jgi:hypothetical protein